jgi:hypothetical protein
MRQLERLRIALQAFGVGGVRAGRRANDHEPRVGPRRGDGASGGDEVLEPLHRHEARHGANDGHLGRDPELGTSFQTSLAARKESSRIDGREIHEPWHRQGLAAVERDKPFAVEHDGVRESPHEHHRRPPDERRRPRVHNLPDHGRPPATRRERGVRIHEAADLHHVRPRRLDRPLEPANGRPEIADELQEEPGVE